MEPPDVPGGAVKKTAVSAFAAAEMEQLYFPQADWIIDAIHERILPLKEHRPLTVQTTLDLIRRNRLGV